MSDGWSIIARHIPARAVAWAFIIIAIGFAVVVAMTVLSVVVPFEFKLAGMEFGRTLSSVLENGGAAALDPAANNCAVQLETNTSVSQLLECLAQIEKRIIKLEGSGQ